jgi:hypothetical protein
MTEADIRWIKNWKPKGVKMKDEDYIHDRNPLITKLLKLKYRINEMYRSGVDKVYGSSKDDKNWVMNLISDVRTNNLTKLSSEDGKYCNGLWRKYE